MLILHAIKHRLGLKNWSRIHAINRSTPDNAPPLQEGTLYLEGAGMASAYVAKRGAEIYLSGDFNQVVITGGNIPAQNLGSGIFSEQLENDGLPLPEKDQTEGEYIAQVFMQQPGIEVTASNSFPEHNMHLHTLKSGVCTKQRLFILVNNNGIDTKFYVQDNHMYLRRETDIQAVTSIQNKRRLDDMLYRNLGEAFRISVEGVYPFNRTKDNWHEHDLAYATIMNEANQKKPAL